MIAAKQRDDGPAPATIVPGLPPALSDLCGELLVRRPELRPGGAEVLARLNRVWSEPGAAPRVPAPGLPRGVFVGRDAELRALQDGARRCREQRSEHRRVRARQLRDRQDRAHRTVPQSAARTGAGRGHPDRPLLRTRIGALQGPRQHRRRAEPVSAPDRARGGCRHAARRGGARAALPRAAPGRADRAQPRSQCRDRRLAGAAAPRVRGVPRAVRAPGASAGRSCCSSTICTGETSTAPRS